MTNRRPSPDFPDPQHDPAEIADTLLIARLHAATARRQAQRVRGQIAETAQKWCIALARYRAASTRRTAAR